MDAYAVHDHLGNIVSVSFVNSEEGLDAGLLPPEGHTITQVQVPASFDPQDGASIESLVRDYRIDTKSGQLIQAK